LEIRDGNDVNETRMAEDPAMPINYRIDHDRRIVFATGRGTMTDADVFGYQREVWSQPALAGYDELMDMTPVEAIAEPSAERVRDLATLSAAMDPPGIASKFAIVAPQDSAFGLGRMFETYRQSNPRSKKAVSVFRTMAAALTWLGVE
jgi:hypothetical protein